METPVKTGGVAWENYPAVHAVEKGDTLYADVVNHCKDYQSFLVSGSKVSSCHECTHGANADLRNRRGVPYKIGYATYGDYHSPDAVRLPQPHWPVVDGRMVVSRLGNVNCFYAGQNRAVTLTEPAFRKSTVAAQVPGGLRGMRFSQYVTGQTAWDDTPLYLFDEWQAYQNGEWAAVTLKQKENYSEGGRVVDGALEFVAYGVAVLMTAARQGDVDPKLADFTRWAVKHSFNAYFAVKSVLGPQPVVETLYNTLKTGGEAADLRAFLQSRLNLAVPDGPVGEDDDVIRLHWYL